VGNKAPNQSNIFRWYSRFRYGRELVEIDKRGGRPKSPLTEVNIAAVVHIVKNDRRIASRMIAESLNIPMTVVFRILKEDVRDRSMHDFFFLHDTPPAHKAASVCQFFTLNILQTFINHPLYSPDLSPPDYFLFPRLKLS
jgi:hypothetical protein